MNLYFRVRDALFRLYGHVALHRWFTPALVALFVIFAIVQLIVAVGLIVLTFVIDLSVLELSFGEWASVGSTSVSAVLVAIGIRRLRRSRVSAYRWFQRAILGEHLRYAGIRLLCDGVRRARRAGDRYLHILRAHADDRAGAERLARNR